MEGTIIRRHPLIEEIFSTNEAFLGKDLEKYKNHVYRIFNYALYLSNYADTEQYAVASGFHDLGIWTDNTFDYLQPSVFLAEKFLIEHREFNFSSEEISAMIFNHHKISSYNGMYKDTVEVFRKADWTDVSMGMLRFEIPRDIIVKVKKQFPYKGFHLTLLKLFLKNFIKHPLDPLPMFRK